MIDTTNITINGRIFTKTFSTLNLIIERDGEQYSEAIDPVEYNRQYTETDVPIKKTQNLDDE